jgi:hypothetical protein
MIHYRERDIPVEGGDLPVTVFYNGTPPNWNPPFATQITIPYRTPTYSRYFEKFWWDDNRPYDWIPYNENYRRQNKPCQHFKRYLADSPLETSWRQVPWCVNSLTSIGRYKTRNGNHANRLLAVDGLSFRSQFGTFGSHTLGLPLMWTDQLDQSFIPEPTGLNILVKRSLSRMLPSIKANLSLVNSVIELKDFKSLPRTITSINRFSRDIPQMLRNIRKMYSLKAYGNAAKAHRKVRSTFNRAEGRTLREMFRTPAEIHLQEQFNLQPLLQDIVGIYTALSGLEKQMNNLLQREGRLQKKHYNFRWLNSQFTGANKTAVISEQTGQFAGSTIPAGTTGSYNYLYRQLTHFREVLVDPSSFHAEIEFRYFLNQFQTEHSQILGLLDSLGVNLDPAIIWNAIPWSFVVDWVLGVNRWLSNRKVLNMEPRISIERYIWSWRYSRRIRQSFWDTVSATDTDKVHRTWMPDLYEEAYRRDVKIPSFSDPLFVGSLNSREISLGVALAITRRRRPNTRMRG